MGETDDCVATKFGRIGYRCGSDDDDVRGYWRDCFAKGRRCCGASYEGEDFEASWYIIAMYCMDRVGVEYCTIRGTSQG